MAIVICVIVGRSILPSIIGQKRCENSESYRRKQRYPTSIAGLPGASLQLSGSWARPKRPRCALRRPHHQPFSLHNIQEQNLQRYQHRTPVCCLLANDLSCIGRRQQLSNSRCYNSNLRHILLQTIAGTKGSPPF